MAGDAKTTDSAEEVAPPVISDPYPTIQKTLDATLADQRRVGWETLRVEIDGAIQSQHVRFRVRSIIISCDIADEIVLLVGTGRYPFRVAPGVSPSIDLPILIERGLDFSATSTGAGVGSVYLAGYPE